jgi:hypothetical protein
MTRRRALLFVALGLSVALLAWASLWRPKESGPIAPPTGLRVVVVGIDGMDWFLVANLVEQGKLPTIGRILRSAVTAEITPDRPAVPEVGWTEIGSGRLLTDSERATVEGTGDRRLEGLVPALALRVRDAGGKPLVVGWPGAWPVAPGDLPIVAGYTPSTAVHEASLPAALFAGAPGQASDAALAAAVDAAVRRDEGSVEQAFERQILGGGRSADPRYAPHLAAARWAFLSDLTALDVACGFIAEHEPDCSLVYLGGLDVVSHRFLAPAMPAYFPTLQDPGKPLSDVLANYYVFIDSALERILRLADNRTILVVCSAYGIQPTGDVPGASGSHEGGSPGVFMVWAPRLAQPSVALTVSPLDIAPTALAALGFPVPTDSAGRVVTEALPQGLLEQFPIKPQGPRERRETPAPPVDRAAMDAMVEARMERLSVAPEN